MSMDVTENDVSPIDPDDELLVAYLDGELSNKERDELEDRLLADESLRLKLQSLQAGWEMLESLPSPTTNERLVESTLELVVSDVLKSLPLSDSAKEASSEPAPLAERNRWPLFVGGACLLLIAAGWFAGRHFRKSKEHEQLMQLELAENLDAYLWSGDLKLMRVLQNDATWLNMLTTVSEIGQINAEASTVIAETPVESRFDLISNMKPAKRSRLENRWDELKLLDRPMLHKVHETAMAVEAQPDSDTLLQTMTSYAAWRSTLPAETRDAIEKSEGVARQKAIADAIAFTLETASRQSGGMLDEDTVERIYWTLSRALDDRIKRDPQLREAIQHLRGILGEAAQPAAIGAMLRDEERGRSRGGGGRMMGSQGLRDIKPITMSELDVIIGILSDSAIDNLNLLTNWSPYSGRDQRLLESTLRTWAEETVQRKLESFRPDRGTLVERYLQLGGEERDELDMQPPNEIKRRLNGRGRSSFGR